MANVKSDLVSSPDVSIRFNRTLREVVQRDYMPEIQRLQQRLERLEARATYTVEREESQHHFDEIPTDNKYHGFLDRLDTLRDETNRHVQEMGAQLQAVLQQDPKVGNYWLLCYC